MRANGLNGQMGDDTIISLIDTMVP